MCLFFILFITDNHGLSNNLDSLSSNENSDLSNSFADSEGRSCDTEQQDTLIQDKISTLLE